MKRRLTALRAAELVDAGALISTLSVVAVSGSLAALAWSAPPAVAAPVLAYLDARMRRR